MHRKFNMRGRLRKFSTSVNRPLPEAKTGYEKGLEEEYAAFVVGEQRSLPFWRFLPDREPDPGR